MLHLMSWVNKSWLKDFSAFFKKKKSLVTLKFKENNT